MIRPALTDELKAKWLDALRSGNYQQGHYELRRKEFGKTYYCCLGVLCEVAGFASQSSRSICRDGRARMLDDITQSILSNMNDRGVTFAEIADHIEKHIVADSSWSLVSIGETE